MSLVSTEFHKRKRVVENGKERDLMFSPKRIPSTATHVNHFLETHPLKLKPSPNPPSYWQPGSAAAAAKRTREVCDELYWAALESGEDAIVAATATTTTTSSSSRRSTSRQQQPSRMSQNTSRSSNHHSHHHQRPQSAGVFSSASSGVTSSTRVVGNNYRAKPAPGR